MRVDPWDVGVAAIAAPLAMALRDPAILERTPSVIYCGVAFVVAIALAWHFRLGADMARFFSWPDAIRIAKVSVGTALLTATLAFSLTRLEEIPRSLPVIHMLVLGCLLAAGRALARIRHSGRTARPVERRIDDEDVILVGTSDLARLYIAAVDGLADVRQRIVGVVDVDGTTTGRLFCGHAVLGPVEEIGAIIDELAVHGVAVERVVVATETAGRDSAAGRTITGETAARNVAMEFLPALMRLPTSRRSETAASVVAPKRSTSPIWTVKRGVDVVVSLALIVALAPVLVIVAAVVWMSFGSPLVFWQQRLGRGESVIHVHKFRTMRAPIARDGRVLAPDERETVVGTMLRKSRLDELPQLFDVLRGDMSLIGPRPLLPVDQPADRAARLSVRPGITGWAQVHGGREISPAEKNRLDVWYIENASLALDLRILFMTLRAVLLGDRRRAAAARAAAMDRVDAV